MKLTFEEIRSLTHGADHFTEESDGLHFHKCTERQEEAWKEADEYYVPKTLSTTGIRLETETDAEAITFVAPCGNKLDYKCQLKHHQKTFLKCFQNQSWFRQKHKSPRLRN